MKIIVWFGCVLFSASGKIFHSKVGSSVLLDCGSSRSPFLTWKHNNDLIISLEKSRYPRKGQHELVARTKLKNMNKLEISGVKNEDAGTFTCDSDQRAVHTLLVVSVSASPSDKLQVGSEATLNCAVAGLNPGSTVQWKRPDGSLHEKSQIVKLSPVASSDVGTWQCTFSHDGSSLHEDLNITVNTPPKIPTSTSVTERSEEGQNCPKCVTQPKPAVEELSWWVWVAIGAGCLVVVLLMVLVIVLCKRTRRRKKKVLKMKNGQHQKRKQYCQCNRQTAAPKPQQGRWKENPSVLHAQPLLME